MLPNAAVALLCAALACAGGSGREPAGGKVADTSKFPSQEQLEKLGSKPAAASLFGSGLRRVDAWQLEGPFPATIADEAHSEPGNAWSALLDEAVRRRAGLALATESMYCVARELGRFYLSQRGQPTPGLRSFITARCRASVADVSYQVVEGTVPPGSDDAAAVAAWKASATAAIRTALEGGPRTVGIWFGRESAGEGDRAVLMVAAGDRELVLDPSDPVVGEGGVLELSGESLAPTNGVRGLVNRGRFGFADCEPVGQEAPPRFRLRCTLDPDDDAALVTLSVFPPGRLLSDTGLIALASHSAEVSTEYRRPVYAESWPMLASEKIPDDFTEMLNRVRREAKLAPLVLDPGQSEVASELAPHFFAATFGASDAITADVIVLGMLAGWSVDGIVQAGHVSSSLVMQTNDLSDLLASALEFPAGRATLLTDDAQRLAVGPLLSNEKEHQALAALFGTYSLFSEKSHDAAARRVLEKLDAERRSRGVEPLAPLGEIDGLCRQAASAVQVGGDPTEQLNALLQGSSELLQRPVSGWIAEVSDLDTLKFPEEYLKRPSLGVSVAVGHRRPKGEAWGRYVVMLVIADPEARGV